MKRFRFNFKFRWQLFKWRIEQKLYEWKKKGR